MISQSSTGKWSTRTHNPLLERNQLFLFLSSGFKVAVNQGLQFNQVFVLPFLLDVLEKRGNSLSPYCSSIMCWTFPAPCMHRETKLENICRFPSKFMDLVQSDTQSCNSQEPRSVKNLNLPFPYTLFYPWLCLHTYLCIYSAASSWLCNRSST